MESKWNQNGRPTEDIPKTYRNIKKHIHQFNKRPAQNLHKTCTHKGTYFTDLIKHTQNIP